MRKLILIVTIIFLLACVVGFKISREAKKYENAKGSTEILALEKLGQECKLLSHGTYLGPEPYGRGFWFGFTDKDELTAVIYTAVPTLDGDNWLIREHISWYGGNVREFFSRFKDK